MEQKTRYQYTYFIYPYTIEEKQYNNYILKLLLDPKCKIRVFEKEKDLDIYTYFNEKTRKYMFPTFEYTKEKKKELNKMKAKKQAKELKKETCNIFEYSIGADIQGKIGEKDGIFFTIDKIEIICYQTGICFLTIKTRIEESENLEDILNFNYKFKDITSEFSKLKEYEKIKIQTNIFTDMKDFTDLISEITGQQRKKDDKRFFVYTYCCVDSAHWNNQKNEIEKEFLKYAYVLPNSYHANFSKENDINRIEKWQYVNWGITKQCSALMVSNIETLNYTKLPFAYENEYLYTVIINLYKKTYLEYIKEKIKENRKTELFDEYLKEIWTTEITKDETGELLDEKWTETLELEELYREAKNKYEIVYKQLNIEKNRKINKILVAVLAISLLLNIVNLVLLMKMM